MTDKDADAEFNAAICKSALDMGGVWLGNIEAKLRRASEDAEYRLSEYYAAVKRGDHASAINTLNTVVHSTLWLVPNMDLDRPARIAAQVASHTDKPERFTF